jgi:hypothetical protein
MSTNRVTPVAEFPLQPTFSVREAAALLGKSYSWLDQRVRRDRLVLLDGSTVQPFRTPAGYRRFTLPMLEDIVISGYEDGWLSTENWKSAYRELLIAAHRENRKHKIPS